MNILLALFIFSGLDVYFLKGTTNLLVRIVPEEQIEQLTLYYSFSAPNWDSMVIKREGRFFDAGIATPEMMRVIGLYCIYDNGTVDNKDGAPYLYEVKKSPQMIMPFAMGDLEVILKQARKKITSNIHVDEAITLLDYVDEMLRVVPVIENSPGETQRNMLQMEVMSLREQLIK